VIDVIRITSICFTEKHKGRKEKNYIIHWRNGAHIFKGAPSQEQRVILLAAAGYFTKKLFKVGHAPFVPSSSKVRVCKFCKRIDKCKLHFPRVQFGLKSNHCGTLISKSPSCLTPTNVATADSTLPSSAKRNDMIRNSTLNYDQHTQTILQTSLTFP